MLPLILSWEQVKGTNLSNTHTWALTVTGRKGAQKSADIIILMRVYDLQPWPPSSYFIFICVCTHVKGMSKLQHLSPVCPPVQCWNCLEHGKWWRNASNTLFPTSPSPIRVFGPQRLLFLCLLKLQAVLSSLGKGVSALIYSGKKNLKSSINWSRILKYYIFGFPKVFLNQAWSCILEQGVKQIDAVSCL